MGQSSRRKPLPRLITVAGLRKSGKTAVVEALVAELRSRGHEVGTIKTMRHHDTLTLDREATDTSRHARAGASVVVAILADGTARFETGVVPASREQASRYFPQRIRIIVSEGAVDPAEPQPVVLCLRSPSELEEALRIRRIPRSSVLAISGMGASAWNDPSVPAFDVREPAQRRALADLVLGEVESDD